MEKIIYVESTKSFFYNQFKNPLPLNSTAQWRLKLHKISKNATAQHQEFEGGTGFSSWHAEYNYYYHTNPLEGMR